MQASHLEDHLRSCYSAPLLALNEFSAEFGDNRSQIETLSLGIDTDAELDISDLVVPTPVVALHRSMEEKRKGLIQRWLQLDKLYLETQQNPIKYEPKSDSGRNFNATTSQSAIIISDDDLNDITPKTIATNTSIRGSSKLCVPRGLDIRDPFAENGFRPGQPPVPPQKVFPPAIAARLAESAHPLLPSDPERRQQYLHSLASLFAEVPHMDVLEMALEKDKLFDAAVPIHEARPPCPPTISSTSAMVDTSSSHLADGSSSTCAAETSHKAKRTRTDRSHEHGTHSSIATMEFKHGKGAAVWRVLEGSGKSCNESSLATTYENTKTQGNPERDVNQRSAVYSFTMHAPHLDTDSSMQGTSAVTTFLQSRQLEVELLGCHTLHDLQKQLRCVQDLIAHRRAHDHADAAEMATQQNVSQDIRSVDNAADDFHANEADEDAFFFIEGIFYVRESKLQSSTRAVDTYITSLRTWLETQPALSASDSTNSPNVTSISTPHTASSTTRRNTCAPTSKGRSSSTENVSDTVKAKRSKVAAAKGRNVQRQENNAISDVDALYGNKAAWQQRQQRPYRELLSAVLLQASSDRSNGMIGNRAVQQENIVIRSMSTALRDVRLRLGGRYLYVHRQHCEHLLYLSDITLLPQAVPVQATDVRISGQLPLAQLQYPHCQEMSSFKQRVCGVCDVRSAAFITYGDVLTPYMPFFFCHECYHLLHYSASDRTSIQGTDRASLPRLLYSGFRVFPYEHDQL